MWYVGLVHGGGSGGRRLRVRGCLFSDRILKFPSKYLCVDCQNYLPSTSLPDNLQIIRSSSREYVLQ